MIKSYLLGVVLMAFVITSGLVTINFNHHMVLPVELTNPNIIQASTKFDAQAPFFYHKQYDIYLKDEIKSYRATQDVIVEMFEHVTEWDTVIFHLAGYGGAVEPVFRLINVIKASPALVIMSVEAPVYSGHAYLAVSGNVLKMYPYSYLMFHTSSGYGEDCTQKTGTDRTVSNVEHCEKQMAYHLAMVESYIDQIEILTPLEKILIKTGHDVYITPETYKERTNSCVGDTSDNTY